MGGSRSVGSGRRRWWLLGAGLALGAIAATILVQALHAGGHRPSRASVATIRAEALSTYAAMRPTVEAESVYLAARPVLTFTRYVAQARRVSFPSGTVQALPAGGAWSVSVGAAADPTDPTRQVNMLFAPAGALIRAVPAQIPGVVRGGARAPSAGQLSGLLWRDADVHVTETQGPWCSGPACATATGADATPPRRYPHARVTIETATLRGTTIVAVNGVHMHPNTPYYLVTTAGIIGSAKTSPSGALVAILTVPAVDEQRAEARGHGIAVLQGYGWEFIQACLFGGTVTNLTKHVTCR
jgi:hypothetical protein